MATKIVTAESLQTVLQLIARDIKAKAEEGHVHSNYVTTTVFNSTIANINSFDVLVVDALPTEDINTHTIYLKPKSVETNDIYDEFLYINGKWEHIGNTKVDLSEYIKTDVVTQLLKEKSDTGHTHAITDTTGLDTALKNKADATHTHAMSEITSLSNIISNMQSDIGSKANETHTHSTTEVNGLTEALNKKANESHVHAISHITDLQTTLDAKAPKTHTHNIADTNGLQTILDNKSDSDHTHNYEEISGTPTVDAFMSGTSTNAVQNKVVKTYVDEAIANAVTGGQLDLSDYAKKDHTHEIAHVTGLQTALDGKAEEGHNHDDVYMKIADYELSTAGDATTWWTTAKA